MPGAPASGWRYDLLFTQIAVSFLNPAAFLSVIAALWWTCSVAVLLLSFVASLAHPLRKGRGQEIGRYPPISALVPVKMLHPEFETAQRSLFAQDYPELEIIISAAESDSPAIRAIKKIQAEFPQLRSRFIQSHCDGATSPKLNTLWPAICDAHNDLMLAKDSNLHLGPGELLDLVHQMQSDTGLVSTISIATSPRSFPAWIEASIIDCYHARVLMLADAVGLGFGLGKIMLFRRSDVMRAGGFEGLAWALGEDMAMARMMAALRLRTVLAPGVSHQPLGVRSFSEFWQRQLRWMIVWRVQLPAAFAGDILGSALPTALAGALAATFFGFDATEVAAATLAVWFVLETALCAAKGWPLSLWSLPAFLAREILTPIIWLRALTTLNVTWAGTTCRAGHNNWTRSATVTTPAAPGANK
ncbi:MAG TPA: glycosyltransferase [Rhizomicrobium sp.]|jgi:ceramide glucosyltransferase|nr:glycosyltransferase [Rhizomicrobium sp.]